jgi:hypothetical protein
LKLSSATASAILTGGVVQPLIVIGMPGPDADIQPATSSARSRVTSSTKNSQNGVGVAGVPTIALKVRIFLPV